MGMIQGHHSNSSYPNPHTPWCLSKMRATNQLLNALWCSVWTWFIVLWFFTSYLHDIVFYDVIHSVMLFLGLLHGHILLMVCPH